MSLQIWLPFNGHYKNQGLLGDVQINNAAPSFINDSEKGSVYSSGSLKISAEQAKILFSPNEFSFACWVKPISASDDGSILFGNDSVKPPNNREFSIYLYPTVLDLHCSWQNESDTDAVAVILISDFFILNKWTHVAITYKNQTINIYKNGVLYRTETSNITKRTQFFETTLMREFSNANLSDYRVYNHCLSPLEIKQLSVGLIGHYPLNQFEKSSKNLIDWNAIAFMNYPYNLEYNNLGNYLYSFKSPATLCRIFNLNMNGDGTKIYTISGYIKSTKDCYAELDLCDTESVGFNLTSEWKKFIIIRKPINYYDVWNYNGFFDIYVGGDGGIIYVKDVKLEEGENRSPIFIPNYAKDWPQIEYDISGLTNNIPLSEDINPLFVSDTARYSGSYNFNEVGQTIGTREHIKPTKNVSISAWVKSSKIDTVTEPNIDVDGINIYVNNSGIIHLVGTFGDLNSGVSCIDAWIHVCGTYDGTTVKLYINGALKSSKSYSSDLKYVKGAAISSDSKSGITCKVSDFRIFSTALKDDYITDLYNMGAAVSSGTLAAYELNE